MTNVLFALAIATSLPWPYQTPIQPVLPVVAQPPAQVPTTPPAQDPAPAPAAKSVILTAPIVLPLTPAELQARRDNLGMMESLLKQAVLNGARRVVVESQATVAFSTVQPRAKGFVLEGYGLFFDVEVPQIDGSVELNLQQLQREIARRLEEQQQATTGARRATQMMPGAEVDQNAMYREAVMVACMHAMLDYSKNLDVQPNEWLTVALRASDPPAASMELRDSHTVQLRIKGSDLADYLASRLTKAEALKRVEKREF